MPATIDEKTWSHVLAALEPSVSRPNYVTWLQPTRLVELNDGLVIIAVPNPYAKNWIEKNILKDIRKFLATEVGPIEHIQLVVAEKEEKRPLDELPLLQNTEDYSPSAVPVVDQVDSVAKEKQFNSHYTFETFIVGNNNRLAFAASQVVAEKPGESYNPLFLYGGVGLGKTHLMQAIGNEIAKRDPKKKIIYTSCEIFTGEFIEALQNKTINAFKKKYRGTDVFLIDDIQFLVNKEGTQEEFFHTFNILHQANRQIVITSDRTPKEITKLEDRLTSRLGWGMVADIQAPNIETRTAILQAKAKEKGVDISHEVLDYVASAITSNVRELEGSLVKLITTAQIEKAPITKDYAKKVLKDLASSHSSGKKITGKQLLKAVATHFDIEVSDLLGKKRLKELVYPRHLAMYLLKENLHHSFPQIGDELNKDHTTIMHGVRKIEEQLKTNQHIEADLRAIEGVIN
ncbi:MAG TPA: chromosomal replication initiator protein DnaA [Candidatus Saccharimonadales bacterium]|nr:chromosomal replication initiator protein DnaA [Candidatus Saccharimonadales bacterium]